MACRLYNIFQHYLTNSTICEKTFIEYKMCFDFSTIFAWNISHSMKNSARCDKNVCRFHWPRGLRRSSAAAHLLRSWARIPPWAWMFVCCEWFVLSGRGLCYELITRPEESYRLWCVVVCDQETSWMRRPWPALGRSATGGKTTKKTWIYLQCKQFLFGSRKLRNTSNINYNNLRKLTNRIKYR